MQLTIPNDREALVQKRLASGAFANAEDVIRRAQEAQDDDLIKSEPDSLTP